MEKNMRLRLSCLIVLTLIISGATGQVPVEQGDLTVVMSGFDNDDGVVKIALCDTQEDYEAQDQAYRGEQTHVKNRSAHWTFEKIPYGEYAIKIYHDENNDNELDTNFLGMPTEEYGFSNNARGTFGPASWEDAKFLFHSAKDTLQIAVE
jgi:uncharacterized protein (DUF2141 family)